jgi:hypothetical protein
LEVGERRKDVNVSRDHEVGGDVVVMFSCSETETETGAIDGSGDCWIADSDSVVDCGVERKASGDRLDDEGLPAYR